MAVAEGDIVVGRVTGTTNFGAFVSLPDGQSGLIHISELSNSYVEKVEDYVSKDDEVKVKVLSVDGNKIGLSMKQLEEKKPKDYSKDKPKFKSNTNDKPKFKPNTNDKPFEKKRDKKFSKPSDANFDKPKPGSFEDMMATYLKDANTNMDSIRSRDGKRGQGQRYR